MSTENTTAKTAARSGFSTRDLTFMALSIALIAVCSWISIPMTVPFTLQTFAVCLTAALLGQKRGICATAAYILLGAVGVPVFSGFKGGPGALLGTTGGYIVGFLFTALIVGFAAERFGRSLKVLIPAMVLGILACYVFGTAWFMIVYMKNSGPIGIGTALGWCVIPYIPADAAKLVLASVLAQRLYSLIAQMETRA